jgi:murein DD-endopeptidase MepM/ murein hydrolase activator NlpD
MNIIFLSRKYGRPMTLQLKPAVIAVAAAAFLALCAGLCWIGYSVAAHMQHPGGSGAVNIVRVSGDDEMKAMTARLADMQARLVRLDALGEHLAESENLKGREFDFSAKKAPMGGPLTGELKALGDRPSLELRLQELAADIDLRQAQLEAMDSVLSGRKNMAISYLANMPVRNGYVTSRYGYRTDPFTNTVAFHPGIDFAGPEGTSVYAVAAGVVTWAGPRTGYGNIVEINHGDGYSTRYAHASAVTVKVGDMVSKDQLVAYMGSTGRSTGPHLHYEVLDDGKQIDPAMYIARAK